MTKVIKSIMKVNGNLIKKAEKAKNGIIMELIMKVIY